VSRTGPTKVARLHVRHLVRSDGFAGVERYLTYVGPELVRRGHDVSVVGGAPGPMRDALAGTGVHFTPARTVAEVLRAATASPAPDILHAHMTAAELSATLAAVRLRCPVVATLHFGGGRGHSSSTRLAYRAIAARIDIQLAVSRFVADQAGPGVRVLAPGIPTPPSGAERRDAGSVRGVVLVAQRLEPEKDTDVALRAWAESGLGDRGWELHVAGEGSLEPQLRALAEDLSASGSIRFIGHRSDLAGDLRDASILLAPTPLEAFGLTVVEAMALGVPVVAAAGGGHLETVGPVDHDLLFTCGDPAAASLRLLHLADDAEARAQIGRDLQARFEAEYRIERHAEQLESVYRELVAPPRHTRPADGRRSIAFVFPACERGGGVERVVRELARGTAATHHVTFVGDRFDADGMQGVAHLPVGGRRWPGEPAPLSFRRRAAAALEGTDFDLVVGFGVECPPVDVAVVGSVHRVWLGRSGPVPTPLGSVPSAIRFAMPRHLALLALERSYFRHPRLRAVLATSPATADEITRTYAPPRAVVEVMPNGYDPAEFNPQLRITHREDLRHRLGVTDDDVVVLFVANELHRKGFVTLLDAVAHVADDRLRIEMVGRADPAAYRARIDELSLHDRVRWNGPSREVAEWYALADLLVLPTVYEPFGNVVIEALACGLPVIVSADAGAAAAVHADVNGLLQRDPADADELAGLLRSALEPGRLTRWTRDATTDIERYDWDRVVAQFVDTIDRVVAEIETARPDPGSR
jgi:glycosyltransferase involved in cell wall biosynthesis